MRSGYHVAIVGRDAERLNKATNDIKATGGNVSSLRLNALRSSGASPPSPLIRQVNAFPVSTYDYAGFQSAFASIRAQWPGVPIRAALFNVGHAVWKPFLETTEEDVRATLESNVLAGFGFARQAVTAFKENDLDALGKRGTLIFTGATASTRGNVITSAISAGKHGVRALSQSLAKEFGKQNIHVRERLFNCDLLLTILFARSLT